MLTDDIPAHETAEPPSTAAQEAKRLSAPRFCNRCGRPRESDALECRFCAPEAADPIAQADHGPNSALDRDVRSVKSAVVFYFALLGVSAAMIAYGMVSGSERSATTALFGSALFSIVTLGGLGIIGFRQIVELVTARFHPGWLLFAICAALPTYLLATSVVNLLYILGVERAEYVNVFLGNGYGFGWAVADICVQPAVFEEIAFRGIIQGSLSRVLEPREALIVSALMFGILHLSIPSLPHLLALGLVLGWLRMKTNSLVPGMALHFAHNYLVIVTEQTGSVLPW